jgi:hypothetical protein
LNSEGAELKEGAEKAHWRQIASAFFISFASSEISPSQIQAETVPKAHHSSDQGVTA